MKKVLLVTGLILLVTFALAGCSDQPTTQTTADVYGQVIFPDLSMINNIDNNMMGRAVVYLDGDQYLVTESDGRFAFHNVLTGNHTLKVDGALFKSKEYKINVTADGLRGVKLNSSLLGLIAQMDCDTRTYDANYELNVYPYLFVSDFVSGKMEYLNPDTNKYEELLSQDVTNIFEYDVEYPVKITAYNSAGNMIEQLIENIEFKILTINYPAADEDIITDPIPTFTWEVLDGPVSYEVELYSWDDINQIFDRVYLTNNDKLTESSYTLQLDEYDYYGNRIEQLTDGKYKIVVYASYWDKAGYDYKRLVTYRIFNYSTI